MSITYVICTAKFQILVLITIIIFVSSIIHPMDHITMDHGYQMHCKRYSSECAHHWKVIDQTKPNAYTLEDYTLPVDPVGHSLTPAFTKLTVTFHRSSKWSDHIHYVDIFGCDTPAYHKVAIFITYMFPYAKIT